ncbi:MAG: hypothetical protein KBS81_00945, partial [Spirochaetales bacterium]|nr:hypothetical protein [Candidatus Physcosoma equi]
MTTYELEPEDNIGEILRTAPEGPVTLILRYGIWREKVVVTRPDVTIVSEEGAVIQADDRNGTIRGDVSFGIGESATFTVAAPAFTAMGVTFTNSFDYESAVKWNREHKNEPPLSLEAPAFRSAFGSDVITLRACNFRGHNGTLMLDYGNAFLEDCTVEGTQDFILGAGSALFQGCDILSLEGGTIIAPSTPRENPLGFLFHDCNFATEEGLKDASVFLAHPWHPYGAESRNPMVLLVDCSLSSHVSNALWSDLETLGLDGVEKTWRDANSRFYIYSDTHE